MDVCVNCNSTFEKREKGYRRYSLEKQIPVTGKSAHLHLEEISRIDVTPAAKKIEAKFLCAVCWNRLNDAVKYNRAITDFFGSTGADSYIASKKSLNISTESTSPSTSKKPRFTSTPLQRKSKVARPIFGKQKQSTTKWDTIITAIRARQYRRAMFNLYNATAATKRHFAETVTRVVRKEIKELVKLTEFPLAKEVNIQSVSCFSWDETLTKASEKVPVLYSALKGAVTRKADQESMLRNARVNLKPRVGTALAILLNAKYPNKFKFLHTLLSVQFWRGRLKRETMKQLSHLGLSAGYDATLSAIDKIRKDFDTAAVKLKSDIETALRKKDIRPVLDPEDRELSFALADSAANAEENGYYSDLEETVLYSDVNESVLSQKEADEESDADVEQSDDEEDDVDDEDNIEVGPEFAEEDENDEEEEMEVLFDDSVLDEPLPLEPSASDPPGFTMCWDNVGKKVVTRHPNETVKNRYINMALGYIAINRVPSVHLDWQIGETCTKAIDIPLEHFLPCVNDLDQLRSRMCAVVGRILTRHLEWFRSNFSEYVIPHVIHDYSVQSSYKSVLINLGVFNENPSSTQGAIGIYEKLQQYVPFVDGKLYTSIVYGDGLSCERGNDAQRARSNGLNPSERLEGLEPGAQEFHKEMLLLQDFYDLFFKGSSASNRGTLCQIKNLFNFRQVKADISDNFSHAWELMCLIVEAFVCLLMMQLGNMTNVASKPSSAPENIELGNSEEKHVFFEKNVNNIVDKVWQSLDFDSLKINDGTGIPLICCGEDHDEELIGCECRSSCPRGEYFHYSCAGVDPAHIPTPWYCSDECRNRHVEDYRFCECKTDLGTDEPMIGCAAETHCTRYEWYHMQCLGLDPEKPPKGNWFCCQECKVLKTKKKHDQSAKTIKYDSVYNYSIAVIWRGLNLLCRRDAVREADGDAMLSFWKFDLVHFFGNKHPKYVILAHRLLAAVNGWLPPKLRHDLIHNRTVNYSGGMGRNLPLDFMNEILNRLFKDLLESAKGRYTDTTIQRCSQMIGPLGDSLDKVFDTNIVENELYRHRRRAQTRDGNVARLIDIMYKERLFSTVIGRRHSAFPDFLLVETPKQAGKFAAKILQLSKRLDKRRRITINA